MLTLGKYFGFLVTIFLLSSCGGGGVDSSKSGPDPRTALFGTAAAGLPIVGLVYIKGGNGNTASVPIGSDGSFLFDANALEGIESPYLLYATGSVGNAAIQYYSISTSKGVVNITQLTDYITWQMLRKNPVEAYPDWVNTQIDAALLESTETYVQHQIDPVFDAVGVDEAVDLNSTPFDADRTGIDLALEAINISYSGTVATVTNRLTGSSFVDDISTLSDNSGGLPAGDSVSSVSVLIDQANINSVFNILENLYSTSVPNQELLNTFAVHIADDYLESGSDKTALLEGWGMGNGPEIGFSLTAIISRTMTAQELAATSYLRGYEVKLQIATLADSVLFDSFMVFDGNDWKWFGDQKWLQASIGTMADYNPSNVPQYSTNLFFGLRDTSFYAYSNGVRSAIITGPGLPTTGIVMAHDFPNSSFSFNLGTLSGNTLRLNDTDIINIADNSVYDIRFYAETSDVVALSNTPVLHYQDTLTKRPYRNSDLSSGIFPTITTPASQDLADLSIPGSVNVSWTSPALYRAGTVHLGWNTILGSESVMEQVSPDANSVVLSATGTSVATSAFLAIYGYDIYGRTVNTRMEFQ